MMHKGQEMKYDYLDYFLVYLVIVGSDRLSSTFDPLTTDSFLVFCFLSFDLVLVKIFLSLQCYWFEHRQTNFIPEV